MQQDKMMPLTSERRQNMGLGLVSLHTSYAVCTLNEFYEVTDERNLSTLGIPT